MSAFGKRPLMPKRPQVGLLTRLAALTGDWAKQVAKIFIWHLPHRKYLADRAVLIFVRSRPVRDTASG